MSWFIGLPYSLSRGTPFFYRKFLQHDCGRAGLELGVPWLSGVGPGLNFLEIPMPVVGAVECVGFPFGSGPGRLAYLFLEIVRMYGSMCRTGRWVRCIVSLCGKLSAWVSALLRLGGSILLSGAGRCECSESEAGSGGARLGLLKTNGMVLLLVPQIPPPRCSCARCLR